MKNFAIFLLTFTLIDLAQPTVSPNMCTSLGNIGNLIKGKQLEETSFYTINGLGLVGCARECIKRSRCKSFNFNLNTSECELNYCNLKNFNNGSSINNSFNNSTFNNSSDTVFLEDDQYVFSDIDTWPGRIAGLCHDHSCPENSSCQELEGGLTNCTVECHDPPPLKNGEILTFPIQYDVGSELNFTCNHGYKKNGSAICGATGQWSTFECSGVCHGTPNPKFGEILTNGESGPWPFGAILEVRCNPGFYRRFKKIKCKESGIWNVNYLCAQVQTCKSVKKCNPNYTDGEYWIFPKQMSNRKIRIYCHNMTSLHPIEFITLPYFINHTMAEYMSSSPLQNCTCQATIANKLQIDINKLKPMFNVLHDFTSSQNSSCKTEMVFFDQCCRHEFNVDITGTGLVFDISDGGFNKTFWQVLLQSLSGQISIQLSPDGRVLTGHCLGKPCTGCDGHFENMTLSYDVNFAPENDSATMPMCNT